MKNQILEKIKQFDKIIICRHISPDPDAMGSQMGLYHIIKESFPNKEVYVTGVFPERLSYFKAHSFLNDSEFYGALVIVTDTANRGRIDEKRWMNGDYVIKIDHHPVVDDYGDINWIEDTKSSTSEMIFDFYSKFENELSINNAGLEAILAGIVADTNRFLYSSTTGDTLSAVAKIKEMGCDFTKVYNLLYSRNFVDMKFFGFIINNLEVSDNVAHIVITNQNLIDNNVDVATSSNIISEFNNIHDFYVWVFLTEDVKGKMYRVNIRSRGPVINDIAAKYGGGGHMLASGLRTSSMDTFYSLLEDLKVRVKEYLDE